MITIYIAYAETEKKHHYTSLSIPKNTSVKQVLSQYIAETNIPLPDALHSFGVFGKKVTDEYILQQGDRLELYRPLKIDPMQLRRQKTSKQKT